MSTITFVWLFKFVCFAIVSILAIRRSGPSYLLRIRLECEFPNYSIPKKPNKLLDKILIFFIVFGLGMSIYFIPVTQFGFSNGEILGMIITAPSWIIRYEINN